jgi:hypothetical protein
VAPRPGGLEGTKTRKKQQERKKKKKKKRKKKKNTFAFISTISYPLRELAGRQLSRPTSLPITKLLFSTRHLES